jgi:hypothetical protein
VIDTIGNKLILTAYDGRKMLPRQYRQYTIDGNGVYSGVVRAVTDWVGEITTNNPDLGFYTVSVTVGTEDA